MSLRILILVSILGFLQAVEFEVVSEKTSVSDHQMIGVVGLIGEKVAFKITDREFIEGPKSKDKVTEIVKVIDKVHNEVMVDREYRDGKYTINLKSKDLGIEYSYELKSPFVGFPLISSSDDPKGIAIFRFDGYLVLNGCYYPRIFLSGG